MKRYITRVSVLLLASLLVSCGGGGGDDSPSGGGTTVSTGGSTPPAADGGTSSGTGGAAPGSGGGTSSGTDPGTTPGTDPGTDPGTTPGTTPTPGTNPGPTPGSGGTLPSAGALVEETDSAAVTFTAGWLKSNPLYGWSGGSAKRSNVAGEKVSFRFNGTSVTWIGSRSRDSGIAKVSVDGGPVERINLFSRAREVRTPVYTIHDLAAGDHVLTIEVTGEQDEDASSNMVVVDAFQVEAPIVSRLQETDPDVSFSGTWVKADQILDPSLSWSSAFVTTEPQEAAGGARVIEAAGSSATLTFRGTAVSWMGYRGPSGGIARVLLEARATDGSWAPVSASEVDTYSATQKVQEIVFTASALGDKEHRLTIEATGRKSDAASAAHVVIDAFEVITPGRRYEEHNLRHDPAKANYTFTGLWTRRNVNRSWSEGAAATTRDVNARVDFTFVGTSVSWIGCRKASIGRAKVFIDGAPAAVGDKKDGVVNMFRTWPTEGYQDTIVRIDGLTPGVHTISIVPMSTSIVVVDAFDVRP